MVTALYRRYRPETFAELIGQAQVTDPLRTALRTNRVHHAYLFSGPRGCGKTTSARILARCLNCEQGPTDTPCGVCPSCVELSRNGGGSLDVVEIDAASHNGVDDARDLRERAIFAPARDRFKIFILDEAHMVTPQGFNALLKIVEEPPEHVKFVFATTEPDKVIGTIRSRTHHYPFRLVPPAQMLEYLQQLCESENVKVAAGVLPLVVRAGGGSVRDTLSLLDQLIAGSEGDSIDYERAVALLGYTHGALLDEVVVALGTRDGAAAFGAVDRVIQTGQDPRRFVEDLLERLRDLIVVAATGENAGAVLRGVPAEQLESYRVQAAHFGAAELSRAADVINDALTEMTGATSPRLHLELMIARVLVTASDGSASGALARVERLERRVGVAATASAPAASQGAPVAPAAASRSAAAPGPAPAVASAPAVAPATAASATGAGSAPVAPASVPAAAASAPAAPARTEPSTPERPEPAARPAASAPVSEPGWEVRVPGSGASRSAPAPAAQGNPGQSGQSGPAIRPGTAEEARDAVPAPAASAVPLDLQRVRDSWPEILEAVKRIKLSAWTVVYTAQPLALREDILTLGFVSENDVAGFRQQQAAGQGVSEILRQAILDVLGTRVKFLARVDAPDLPAAPARATAPATTSRPSPARNEPQRYGEAVVREILGASFIEETSLPPRTRE
ncbi:DNA polymerase III subunit gamma and tau [Naasia sp. SYSU D00948]|uniref:DNA polymerase III subunit gamma and tau n=1 Tax=Naasia sp. SYSU D00948 TaxID=2817379 RepID=UPI001B306DC4|nr:DNA polymerase III subunit gamma and tau [Naasia sp. SYSU D00948]